MNNTESDRTVRLIQEDLMHHVRPNRWLSLDLAGVRVCRCNWVVSLMATCFLWGFVTYCLADKDGALKELKFWQTWLTQNFTWLYIGTQVMCLQFFSSNHWKYFFHDDHH